jgi:hypothetical protein
MDQSLRGGVMKTKPKRRTRLKRISRKTITAYSMLVFLALTIAVPVAIFIAFDLIERFCQLLIDLLG